MVPEPGGDIRRDGLIVDGGEHSVTDGAQAVGPVLAGHTGRSRGDGDGRQEAIVAVTGVGGGIDVARYEDEIRGLSLDGIELEGIDEGIGDGPVGGYLHGGQPAIVTVTNVSDGEHVPRDRYDARFLAFDGIELKRIDEGIGDGSVGRYLHGDQPANVTITVIDDGMDIARDVNEVRGLAIEGIEFQGIDGNIGDGSRS